MHALTIPIVGATLFSGIGAPEAAMPHWRWAWHAEIEKFPSAVMAARHPQSVNLGDVTADGFTQRAAEIAIPDVLVFGSPCQSYSIAGKRLGMDDPRGNLALVALGIVDRLKPRWFVFENVPGLFSSFSGSEHAERQVREGAVGGQGDGEENRDFATFLSRVQDIGYSGAWSVLDAQYRGVAQRRERVFFVGHSGDWRAPAAVLLEPEAVRGPAAPRRAPGQDIAPTLSARTRGGGGLGTDFEIDGGIVVFDPTQITSAANRNDPQPGDPSHPLVRKGSAPVAIINGLPRSLTPLEGERLQGFPDHYTAIVFCKKPAADSPRYHTLGDSMPVPIIRLILSRIEMFERVVRPAQAA